jgi:hypothetical protein
MVQLLTTTSYATQLKKMESDNMFQKTAQLETSYFSNMAHTTCTLTRQTSEMTKCLLTIPQERKKEKEKKTLQL